MKCQIVFYLARKTSLCEKALNKALSDINFKSTATHFAANPVQLGETLIFSLAQCNVVFTLGGLYSADSQGIEDVLSKALSECNPDEIKKLKNNLSDYDGYVIKKDCQLIVVLPDEPDEISHFFTGPLKNYLNDFTAKQG